MFKNFSCQQLSTPLPTSEMCTICMGVWNLPHTFHLYLITFSFILSGRDLSTATFEEKWTKQIFFIIPQGLSFQLPIQYFKLIKSLLFKTIFFGFFSEFLVFINCLSSIKVSSRLLLFALVVELPRPNIYNLCHHLVSLL